MTASPQDAIDAAAHLSMEREPFAVGMCLQKVRECYGVPAKAPDAATAWRDAEHKHRELNPLAIPSGVPVFWTGGSAGHGHIAISTGDGECWSTDIVHAGHFDHVRIAEVQRKWGMQLAGWTEDINGVRVWTPPAPPTPEEQMAALLNDLKILAAKYKVSLVWVARVALFGATPSNKGARLARIRAARTTLKGMS